MSSSDLSLLNLSCQTHEFTVVAYDNAQTVDSTGSPMPSENATPNSREKKTTFNYDDCKPNPPELVSSELGITLVINLKLRCR